MDTKYANHNMITLASMKKILTAAILILGSSFPVLVQASVIDVTRGHIVLQVEENGEAWYVDPADDHRYYLGRPWDAFQIMRERSVGISNADLATIPIVGTPWNAAAEIINRVRGKILLQVEENGEAWYVYPVDAKRYYLGRPDDAFDIMRNLGLGITNQHLSEIPVGGDDSTNGSGGQAAAYSDYTISTDVGSFAIKVVTLNRDSVQMVTDTGNETDCSDDCLTKSLSEYITEHGALAGIHGTYFCPPDYSTCASETNRFLPPVYNSNADVMINAGKLPHHSGPMIAVTTDGTYYYFHRTNEFGYSVAEFESRTGKQLQAAIANYPSLIESNSVVVHSESLDSKQQTKASRGGIGYNGDSVYLVTATSASVTDMAYIFKALGADYAMNLDGGGSTALYADGSYKVGPGRTLPNAILFK